MPNDADWTQTAAGDSEPDGGASRGAQHWNKSMQYQMQQRDAERKHGFNSDQAIALANQAANERAQALAAGYDPMANGRVLNNLERGGGVRGSQGGGRGSDRRGRTGHDRRGDSGLLGPRGPRVDE